MFFKHLKRGIALAVAGIMAFTAFFSADFAENTVKASDAATVSFDPGKTYHAGIGIQTATTLWIERMGYYQAGLGGYCPYGEENWNKLTRNYNKKVDTVEPADGKVVVPGDFTNVDITGNGTYTVKLENAEFQGETTISQLFIPTDLPLNSPVKLSNITLNINGKEILSFKEAHMEEEEAYMEAGLVVLLFNHWRDELKTELKTMGFDENASNGWKLLNGTGKESISISFTVSGYEEEPLPMPTAPGKVSISSAKNSKGKKIVVKYKKQADAIGYQIQYSTSKNFKKNKKTKTTKKLKYTIKKLKKKKTYYIRVRAYSKGYTGNLYGSWSAVKKVKVKK